MKLLLPLYRIVARLLPTEALVFVLRQRIEAKARYDVDCIRILFYGKPDEFTFEWVETQRWRPIEPVPGEPFADDEIQRLRQEHLDQIALGHATPAHTLSDSVPPLTANSLDQLRALQETVDDETVMP
jgi:hypothetical protein